MTRTIPLIPRHCQARLLWCHERVDWRVEWCSVVFNDESYNLRSHLAFLQGKVNSPTTLHRLLTPCYCHFNRKVMCFFQQDNTHPHMAAVMQPTLYDVQLPWPAQFPDLSPIEHVWDMMKWELTLTPEPATTIAKLWQRVQNAWDNLSQDDIRHLYDRLRARIHACVAAMGQYTVYWWLFAHPFGLNLSSYPPTVINYLSCQFSIPWTCPWRCYVIFSGSIILVGKET